MSYTVLRLLAFIVPLAILLILGFNEWFSAIIAALVGFAVSLIFLRHSREKVSSALYQKRHGGAASAEPGTSDEEAEDNL